MIQGRLSRFLAFGVGDHKREKNIRNTTLHLLIGFMVENAFIIPTGEVRFINKFTPFYQTLYINIEPVRGPRDGDGAAIGQAL